MNGGLLVHLLLLVACLVALLDYLLLLRQVCKASGAVLLIKWLGSLLVGLIKIINSGLQIWLLPWDVFVIRSIAVGLLLVPWPRLRSGVHWWSPREADGPILLSFLDCLPIPTRLVAIFRKISILAFVIRYALDGWVRILFFFQTFDHVLFLDDDPSLVTVSFVPLFYPRHLYILRVTHVPIFLLLYLFVYLLILVLSYNYSGVNLNVF